jgi:hypothetical protein
MDISKETDAKELKALAYEQMMMIDVAQANLRALQQRIVELAEKTKEK